MCTKPQEKENILSFCLELTPMQNQRADIFNSVLLLYGNSGIEQQKKNLSFTSQRRCISPSSGNSPIHRKQCFLLFFLRYLYPKGKNLIILLCPSWPGNIFKYSLWKLGLCFPEHMLSMSCCSFKF